MKRGTFEALIHAGKTAAVEQSEYINYFGREKKPEKVREARQLRAEIDDGIAVLRACDMATLSEDSEGLGILDSMRIARAMLRARKTREKRRGA